MMETCQNAISPIKMAVKIISFHVLTSSWFKKNSAYGITHLRERKEDLNRLMVDLADGGLPWWSTREVVRFCACSAGAAG